MSDLAYQSIVGAFLAAVPEITGVEDWQRDSDGVPLPYPVFELLVRSLAEHALKDANVSMLERLFEVFEAMACSADREVVNLLYVGILEAWVVQPELLLRAVPYMGRETKKLANEAGNRRRRIIH